MNAVGDVAHGTGMLKNSIHELIITKNWTTAKVPRANTASLRVRMKATTSGMNSSFAYFANDPKASSMGDVVHKMLSANASIATRIKNRVRCSLPFKARGGANLDENNRVPAAPSNSSSLAMLTIAIGKPVAAAAIHTSTRRKLGSFVCKMIGLDLNDALHYQ